MTKNRHELPRKKPERSAKDEIQEDLPTLEPVADELPTLEPVADDLPTLEALEDVAAAGDVVAAGAVAVAVAASPDAAYDTVVRIEVPAMEKAAVVAAIEPVLQRRFAAEGRQLRHRRVLLSFVGDAVIGTAAKDAATKLLAVHKPLLGVVSRGYGDEQVLQGKLPEVTVKTSEADGALRVEVTGDLEPIDLATAFAGPWRTLLASVRGKKLQLVFPGKAKPEAGLRAEWQQAAQAAGATRFAIGERLLFDVELAARVRCTAGAGSLRLVVDPAGSDTETNDALALVLPAYAAACKGAVVSVQMLRPATGPRDHCIAFAREHGAARVELLGDGEPEIVWPPLLAVVNGPEPTLRVAVNGRSRAAVLRMLRREAADHVAITKGKAIVVDWPADFVCDDEVLAACADVAAASGARCVVGTFGGDRREQLVPAPVTSAAIGTGFVLRIDSEAGKAIELQRAFERTAATSAASWRGRTVRVQIAGTAVISRTLVRTVCAAVEAAGAMRLEVEEGDVVDVLLPPMLTVARNGDAVRITAIVDGRDGAQQTKALQRELDAANLAAGAQVTVGPSAIAEAVVAAVLARKAARIVLDGPAPVQVHPPLFGVPEKKSLAVRVPVQAGADAAMVGRQLARELPALLAGLGGLASSTVTVHWPGVDSRHEALLALLAGLVEKKAKKVLLDDGSPKPAQLHPPLAPPVPVASPIAAAPVAAAATVAPTPAVAGTAATGAAAAGGALLTLLGRRDESVPPLVVLGVAVGADPAHLAAVEAELQAHLPRFRGRSVLLVPRAGTQDVPVRKPDALVDLLRRVVPTTAAATLIFRGPDAQGRAHFQVLQSSLRALPVGAVFGDPRLRR